MLISAIIPNHNRTIELQRALRSILKQTVQSFEVIVVDDNSHTDPEPFINEFKDQRIKLIRHSSNLHAAAARNTGAKVAKGEFIAFLDSDDEWMPDHLEYRINHMNENPYCLGSYGAVEIYKDGKRKGSPTVRSLNPGEGILSYLLSGRCKAQTSTLFFRKHAFNKIQFNPNLFQHQDYDLVIRFHYQFSNRFCCIPKASVKLHISSNSPSITKNIHHPSCLLVMQKYSQLVPIKTLINYCLNMASDALKVKSHQSFVKGYLNLLIDNESPKSLFDQLVIQIWFFFGQRGLLFLLKIRVFYKWIDAKFISIQKRLNE